MGSRDLVVKLYQQDKFDYVTPITFELINEKDSILIPEHFLTGTDETQEKIDRFYPGLRDSIFYLCYPYPEVFAIKHLSPSKSQLSRDSLFRRLKAYDNKLVDGEK
jgi:hypothetical protein